MTLLPPGAPDGHTDLPLVGEAEQDVWKVVAAVCFALPVHFCVCVF